VLRSRMWEFLIEPDSVLSKDNAIREEISDRQVSAPPIIWTGTSTSGLRISIRYPTYFTDDCGHRLHKYTRTCLASRI
jgi:hypothetical protein